jgi:NADH dehydrogenase
MINTVAVIGGSGFVGRATVERLARAGKQVIVLCRNSERAKYLKPMGNVGQITLVAGNALDEAVLESVIRPADAVVNLVGILAEGGGQRFDELQAELPARIGALAAKHDVQSLVHVSGHWCLIVTRQAIMRKAKLLAKLDCTRPSHRR